MGSWNHKHPFLIVLEAGKSKIKVPAASVSSKGMLLSLQMAAFLLSVLNIHWKDWCWSWNSSTLAIWCKELTPWKRPWCWERLKVGGEGDDRGWDGWMASLTQYTWVWVSSGSWWWTGRPGLPGNRQESLGSQRVRHDWATELNWTELVKYWYLGY